MSKSNPAKLEQMRARYAADPEYRQRRLDASRKSREADPVAFNEYQRAYRERNRDRLRRNERLRRYAIMGTSEAEYAAMLEAQSGVCAICGTSESDARKGVLDVDHDHQTGRIRGLLCSACNTAIGLLRDDPVLLASAIRYLRA